MFANSTTLFETLSSHYAEIMNAMINVHPVDQQVIWQDEELKNLIGHLDKITAAA